MRQMQVKRNLWSAFGYFVCEINKWDAHGNPTMLSYIHTLHGGEDRERLKRNVFGSLCKVSVVFVNFNQNWFFQQIFDNTLSNIKFHKNPSNVSQGFSYR
jgi:hypothetical protein